MQKKMTIAFFICLLVLENIVVFFLSHSFFEYKNSLKILSANEGLIEKCEVLTGSENLFSVIKNLNEYYPTLYVNTDRIVLDYGNEIANGVGVGFVFDQNYQLTHKSCSSAWTPEAPNFELNLPSL